MDQRDLVVVGASAGGVEALRSLVAALPRDFPACVVVVLHVPPSAPSALPSILSRAGALPVRHAVNEDPLKPGTVLVAPPDHHVVVYEDALVLSRGPRENGHRPAVDVLFRSAARTRGPRVAGVVLSGGLDDGAAGMLAIARRGGACVVQDFDEALHDSMPRAAAAAVPGCRVVPVDHMPEVLSGWIQGAWSPAAATTPMRPLETSAPPPEPTAAPEPDPGSLTEFVCPECHGALFELEGEPLVRFRCRVGHAWSPGSLAAQQAADLEASLWMALRSLEEKATLSRSLGTRASDRGYALTASQLDLDADEAVHAADVLREVIERLGERRADTDEFETANRVRHDDPGDDARREGV